MALASNGLHLGRAVDESRADFQRGDFVVRNVIGVDREVGAVAVGDVVDVGTTVQFQIRDAVSADEDLRELITDVSADGALVFTCNGRGVRFFGEPDHDASIIAEALGHRAVAGMFCAGELGPVGSTTSCTATPLQSRCSASEASEAPLGRVGLLRKGDAPCRSPTSKSSASTSFAGSRWTLRSVRTPAIPALRWRSRRSLTCSGRGS